MFKFISILLFLAVNGYSTVLSGRVTMHMPLDTLVMPCACTLRYDDEAFTSNGSSFIQNHGYMLFPRPYPYVSDFTIPEVLTDCFFIYPWVYYMGKISIDTACFVLKTTVWYTIQVEKTPRRADAIVIWQCQTDGSKFFPLPSPVGRVFEHSSWGMIKNLYK